MIHTLQTEDGEADDDIEEKCQQLATKMSANFSLIEKNLTNQLKYVSGNLDLIKIKSNKQAIYIDKLKKKIAHLTGSGNQFFRANFSGVVQLQNSNNSYLIIIKENMMIRYYYIMT